MTDFASFADNRIMALTLGIPEYGRWSADVTLATSAEIPDVAAKLVVGDLTLLGTAYRMASFAGSRSARVVGGYGGWHKDVPAQAYRGGSVFVSTVLKDAATKVGEKVSVDSADTNLRRYTRAAGPASRALALLGGPLWWVAPDGVTHVGPRPTGTISSDFTVIGWSGAKGKFTIATETVADWLPGKSFTAPTVSGTRRISHVEIAMTNDGKLRLEVLTS